MNHTRPVPSLLRRLFVPGAALITVIALTACADSSAGAADATAGSTSTPDATAGVAVSDDDATVDAATVLDETTTSNSEASDPADPQPVEIGDLELGAVGTLDSSEPHEISVSFDESDYAAMIATYESTEDKEWIEATVTIDGVTYEQVGLRLKGNSSLRGISGNGGGPMGDGADAESPETLPWLIKLDKYVDGQSHDGLTDLVVRSNNSETSLNEAVALELLSLAGLASQDAVATSFSVNGSDPILRLVIDNPDDAWMAEELDSSGALYKAEATGDYSYRGDDPDSYTDVFDQEAGTDTTDLTPLIEFLDFVNNADDVTFAAELGQHLDVDAFATYLAMQDVLDNFDDINGPGNNSYLYYDADTGRFTVVPWDYNLAFGQTPGGGRGPVEGDQAGQMPSPPSDGQMPDFPGGEFPGGELPDGVQPGGEGGFGGRTQSNVLVDRFLAVDGWNELYQERLVELHESLIGSGLAEDVLSAWTSIVGATGLVDEATVTSEASAIGQTLR